MPLPLSAFAINFLNHFVSPIQSFTVSLFYRCQINYFHFNNLRILQSTFYSRLKTFSTSFDCIDSTIEYPSDYLHELSDYLFHVAFLFLFQLFKVRICTFCIRWLQHGRSQEQAISSSWNLPNKKRSGSWADQLCSLQKTKRQTGI